MTTDPELVNRPVSRYIHRSLRTAWRINKTRPMWLIFDYVNPVRQFKRGALYDPDANSPFPEYDPDPENDADVTEDDGDGEGLDLPPYNPIIPECVVPTGIEGSLY